jgi:hypothetical protein
MSAGCCGCKEKAQMSSRARGGLTWQLQGRVEADLAVTGQPASHKLCSTDGAE